MNSVPSPPHWVASRVIQSRNWVVVRGDYKSDGIWGLSSIATPAILLISWLPVFHAIVLCPGNMTVRDHSTYSDQAQATFANSADAWLVTFAHVRGAIIVTNERSAPLSKNVVKIPDACQEFNVQHVDTFSMLRSLGVVFH